MLGVSCSWKDESSSATQSGRSGRSAISVSGVPMLPASATRRPMRAQQMADQRGSGRLAVRPRDRDVAHALEHAQRHLDLAHDRHLRRARGRERRRIGRHAGARDHDGRTRDALEIVRARNGIDARVAELLGAGCGGRIAAAIRRVHAHALAREQHRRADAAAPEADDRCLARPPLRGNHRSLSVLRATSAESTPRIQNRTTTCDSCHPFSSK